MQSTKSKPFDFIARAPFGVIIQATHETDGGRVQLVTNGATQWLEFEPREANRRAWFPVGSLGALVAHVTGCPQVSGLIDALLESKNASVKFPTEAVNDLVRSTADIQENIDLTNRSYRQYYADQAEADAKGGNRG